MSLDDIDDRGREFLLQIYQETNGDPAVQVSMYDIGEQLGLARESASRVAEDLIACQLVEIRTLSGGIGIWPRPEPRSRKALRHRPDALAAIDRLVAVPVERH